MENLPNEKRKAGRPNKTESPQIEGAGKPEQPTVQAVAQQTSVEAKKVEVGISRSRMSAVMNRDEYLAKYVIPRYPEQYVAWVDKEEAGQGWRGWRTLLWEQNSDSLKEVKSMDEASKTHSNILCWRSKEIQDAVRAEWQIRQNKANAFIGSEGYKNQYKQLSQSLREINPGLGAKPLSDHESD